MREQGQLDNMALAMSYVPWQKWEEVFSPTESLEKGTAFPSLVFPFCGKGVSDDE